MRGLTAGIVTVVVVAIVAAAVVFYEPATLLVCGAGTADDAASSDARLGGLGDVDESQHPPSKRLRALVAEVLEGGIVQQGEPFVSGPSYKEQSSLVNFGEPASLSRPDDSSWERADLLIEDSSDYLSLTSSDQKKPASDLKASDGDVAIDFLPYQEKQHRDIGDWAVQVE